MDEDKLDQQDQNSINEAQGDMERKLKKKQNSLKKKVMVIIRKVVIPMLLAAIKVLIPILVIIGLIALFNSILSGGTGSNDGSEGIDSTEDYIVYIEMEGAAPTLEEENLETAIEALYDGEAKENLLSAMDDLMEIQEEYAVNAVFAIAVFQLESDYGTSWEEISEATLDFGREISNNYFADERYSVVQINDLENYDTAYCMGEEEWTSSILSIMTSIYRAAGIQVNSIQYNGDCTVAEFALNFVGENHSRFTTAMGVQADWCAMFVSYCYRECGLIPNPLRNIYYSCTQAYNDYMKNTERWHSRSDDYIPKAGDIIFYDWDRNGLPNHTGIVIFCDGIKVQTVEGNRGESSTEPKWKGTTVRIYTTNMNNNTIFGYFEL